MKNIYEVATYCYGEDLPKSFLMAANWLHGQLKNIPEEKQLAWTKEIRHRDDLSAKYGIDLTLYYDNNDLKEHFEYSNLVNKVALLCVEFYDENGGEMDASTKHFLEKNRMEFGYSGENTPIVISEGKNGEGKFIVSSIL